MESWEEFKKTFNDISKWFYEDPEDTLIDSTITGNGWKLRFSKGHSKKVLEIEEDLQPATGEVKKFKRSVVLAEVSFDHLNNYLYKCIDAKLKNLKKINKSVSVVSKSIIEYVFNDIIFANDAQVVKIDENSVVNFIEAPEKTNSAIENLNQADEKIMIALKDQIPLSIFEKEMLFFQIFSTRMSEIVEILNNKLMLL